jgi:hypothetical protein
MEFLAAPIAITAAACVAGLFQRYRSRQREALERARHVEAERIIALLSAKQPGVWDQEELRTRIQATARDFWSLPTREDLARLETWVSQSLLEALRATWPAAAARREAHVQFRGPVAFLQVNEGGPGPDRLIARLCGLRETQWLDAQGKRVRQERKAPFQTVHTWIHIDGQGWRLEAIGDALSADEPPPSSVSCRIHPEATPEELERY